jgi:hypothetical protein
MSSEESKSTCDDTGEVIKSALCRESHYRDKAGDNEESNSHQKKCVHFKKTAKVILIPKREEYISAGMAPTLWWNGPEYASFRRETGRELSKFMSDWRVSGRQAMDMLYQSNCRKFSNDICHDLIFVVPSLGKSTNDLGNFILLQLSCLMSMQSEGVATDEDWACLHLRSVTSLLFESVLKIDECDYHPILETGMKCSGGLPQESISFDPIDRPNAASSEFVAGDHSSKHEHKRVCQIYSPRCTEDPKRDEIPRTWAEATSKLWMKVPLAIVNDVEPYRIVYANDEWLRCFGYTSAEVIGKTLSLLNGPLTSEYKINGAADRLAYMRDAKRSNDKWNWLNSLAAPDCSAKRQFVAFVAILYTKSGNPIDYSVLYAYLDKDLNSNLFITSARVAR